MAIKLWVVNVANVVNVVNVTSDAKNGVVAHFSNFSITFFILSSYRTNSISASAWPLHRMNK